MGKEMENASQGRWVPTVDVKHLSIPMGVYHYDHEHPTWNL
jgi:hypothetical protein